MGTYETQVNDEAKLVQVAVQGELSANEGRDLITKARELAAKLDYNLFYDMREAIVQVALAEWFHLPRELEVLKDPPARLVRVAVLVHPDHKSDYRFYEKVAANVGLSVRIFLDEDEAMAWIAV